MTETDNYQFDSLKFKLIVIGDQSTGKSSLINKYLKDTFEENCQSTIGIDFQTKTVNIHDQEVRILFMIPQGRKNSVLLFRCILEKPKLFYLYMIFQIN